MVCPATDIISNKFISLAKCTLFSFSHMVIHFLVIWDRINNWVKLCFGRNGMRTRAAVALAAGEPLQVMDVNLEAPKAGEVLVEIKATGICHTDEFTRSGDDPEGIFPAILGHEGAGVVLEVGEGGNNPKTWRSRYPALHARMWQLPFMQIGQDKSMYSYQRNSRSRVNA
jgi:hypothetical protein